MSIRKRKGSPHYWYDFTVQGQRFRGSTETDNRAAAQRVEAKVKNDVIDGTYFNKKPAITLDDAFRRFWEEHAIDLKSGKTGYVNCIRNLLEGLGLHTPIHMIDDNLLAQYVTKRKGSHTKHGQKHKRKVAWATINKELRVLSSMLGRALKWNVATPQVSIREHLLAPRAPLVDFIPAEKLPDLLKVCSPELQDVILLFINTGLREAELMTLDWSQVNFAGDTITARTKSHMQQGKPHLIYLNDITRPILERRWKEAGKPAKGRVFLYRSMKKSFATALKAAGIKRERFQLFHLLRHTSASYILETTGDIYRVQTQLNHSDIKMSTKYAHPNKEFGRDTANVMVKAQIRHIDKKPNK